MKTAIVASFLLLVLTGTGCRNVPEPASQNVFYRDDTYGFSLSLPDSWKGYTVEQGQWQGNVAAPPSSASSEIPLSRGPEIVLRHPQADTTRQEIPIMVFTPEEWVDVAAGKLIVSAAPFPPTELGRDEEHVFALPPRYNYGFETPEMFNEGDEIVKTFKVL